MVSRLSQRLLYPSLVATNLSNKPWVGILQKQRVSWTDFRFHRSYASDVTNIPHQKEPAGFFATALKRVLKGAFFIGAISLTAYIGYEVYNQRHPPEQFSWDPSKKTIAVLGSGWAATSFLADLDTENFNVVVISPRNYFLFTPLLPSCTVGTIELRSIMQPLRFITRFKKREVKIVEGDCTSIDPKAQTLTVQDNSEIVGKVSNQTIPYDYLVIACGAENATFNIPGVKEHACFLKEIWDARKIRTRLIDCIETAAFPGQPEEEIERLLHMVVVGGGPTGVEYAAELHDFLHEDLLDWYPDLAGKLKITLVEAMPHVLPMFSKQLIQYTEEHFAQNKVEILNNTMVKEVKQKEIIVQDSKKQLVSIPYGLLVWATGNTARPVVTDFMKKLHEHQTQRRGITVDETLAVSGAPNVFALGDASATKWAPTAQVASRQGRYLADLFNKLGAADEQTLEALNGLRLKHGSFNYEHLGTLAYIGGDRAIADLPGNVHVGGALTYYFWRSAYLTNLFTLRGKTLVLFDWMKKTVFGRDISRE